MVKREGATHYVPIDWQEAFQLMARELNALPSPNAAAFYTSGRASNEAAFLYQLFVRQFGTNNLPDCSNMCHESSGVCSLRTIGIGKGCVTINDFEKTDCIFIIGQNPGTNHPRMLTSLEHARNNGATIVAINPMPEPGLMRVVNPNPQEYRNLLKFSVKMLFNIGTPLSDLWLPVRINGDMAAMQGIMKEMLAEEDLHPGTVLDREFIESHTTGADQFLTTSAPRTGTSFCAAAALPERKSAPRRILRSSPGAHLLLGHGPDPAQERSRHDPGSNTVLLLGRPRRPVPAPTVPSARSLECAGRSHHGNLGADEAEQYQFMDRLGREFGFAPPREHGVDSVETLRKGHETREGYVSSSVWAAISSPRLPTRNTPQGPCSNAVSPRKFPPNSIALISLPGTSL